MSFAARHLDPLTTMLVLILLAFGWVMIGSATLVSQEASLGLVLTHGVYLALGVGVFAVGICVPLAFVEQWHRVAIAAALIVCVIVLLPGIGHTVNGAQRWVKLGGITFQASEFAKPALLIYLSGYLARSGARQDVVLMDLVPPALAVTGLAALLLLQPDFGAVVVLAAMTIGMLFIAGTRLGYFLLLVGAAGAALSLLVVVQPYRWARFVAFQDPFAYEFSSGYQLVQALIAFGRGDWFGLGLGEGVQKLFYLPEAHNDFILAVVAEELGVVGVIVVVGLLLTLALRALRSGRLALVSGMPFAGYLCYGVGLLISVQCLINAGVNTGLLPTKGLTLPLISYGGNSLIVCFALLALVARTDIELAQIAAKPRSKVKKSKGRRGASRD